MNNNPNHNVALVTGSSSGIGLETALCLSRNGFKTYASMRNLEKCDKIVEKSNEENLPIHIIQLDVTDETSIDQAIEQIIKRDGHIDVLVNNAGFLLIGSVEDLSIEEIYSQFNTNFFGVYRTIKSVLPHMRKQNYGKIINISSFAGHTGIPFLSAYSATKFAMEGLTEALRLEIENYGIEAALIEPGSISTDIVKSVVITRKFQDQSSAYVDSIKKFNQIITKMVKNASHPSMVANKVLEVALGTNLEIRYAVGNDSEYLLKSKRSLSDLDYERLFKTEIIPLSNFSSDM